MIKKIILTFITIGIIIYALNIIISFSLKQKLQDYRLLNKKKINKLEFEEKNNVQEPQIIKEAKEALPTIIQKSLNDPYNLDVLIKAADTYYQLGDLAKAKQYYLKIIGFDVTNTYSLERLGDIEKKEGNYKLSESYFIEALKIDEKNLSIQFKLGDLYLNRTKEYVKAVAHYERAVQINPDNATLKNFLGYAYESVNRLKDAEKIYSTVLANDPNNNLAKKGIERLIKK